ncbi:1-acyl-sn-glycerol-3-phosphate acyltransferase alpha-like [Mytilus galloprovincialis]|uniref:1-acyl-sn-glycerol-3-phosphate acyltransferase alpha-like n=1 Tax=Mytilus galloprovincialis TaxID=29158 RepID=UPI003F7C4113
MLIGLDWLQWAVIACLLTLPIIYELNNTFKYYAKFILYYILVMLVGIVVMFYSLLRPRRPENARLANWLVNHMRCLFGLSIEVRGRENLKYDEAYIIVCNHQSSLDFFAMMEIWPERCVPFAKKELLYLGPFGLALYLVGTVFIDRGNREKAVDAIQKTSDEIRNNKVKVFIFPEGTRNHEGAMLPFKKGAFHLSVNAQVPIVPVVISSYTDFYSKREKKFGTGKFIVTCLPKISTKGLTEEDVPKLADYIRKQMLDCFNQTSLETTQSKLANH